MNEPCDLLAAFGIVDPRKGAVWFLELVWDLAYAWDHGERISVTGMCSRHWKARRMHPRGYYGEIRDALRPIIDAPAEELTKWGLDPEKRTIPFLALGVVRWMMADRS